MNLAKRPTFILLLVLLCAESLSFRVEYALAQGVEAGSPPPTASAPEETPASSPPASDADPLARVQAQVQALSDQVATHRAELDAQKIALDNQRAELTAQKALAELEAASAPVDEIAFEDKLSLYGFMDVGLQRQWSDDEKYNASRNLSGSMESTFAVGNLNVYFDARPWKNWRTLFEVRFSAYPHGEQESLATPLGDKYERTDTTIFDVNSSNGGWAQKRWGAIFLERAHVDWSGLDWLNVRVGQFLTPYGIWNVDHGTPTLISLMQPQFLVAGFFPESQTGLQLLGTFHGGPWELGYHAYVSNGRVFGLQDWTDDKMIGGRVFVTRRRPVPFTLGTSGFWGRATDIERAVVSFEPFQTQETTVIDFTESGWGADLAVDLGDLRLRAESSINRTEYETGKRDLSWGVPGSYWPDRTRWAAYMLAAYRLPWLGLEPFAYAELSRNPTLLSEAQGLWSGGLNIHFSPVTQLKTQYMRTAFFDFSGNTNRGRSNRHDAVARLVVAF